MNLASEMRCNDARKQNSNGDGNMTQDFSGPNPTRRALVQGAGVASLATLSAPMISLAQNKPIRIGMPTILSGRVAMLGNASVNAATMEVAKLSSWSGTPRASRRRLPALRVNW
jgi:hypothetical protein